MARRPGLPRIYLPTPDTTVYWCDFTVSGKRHRLTTGCRDAGQAEKEAQRLYAEASLGRSPVTRRRVSHATAQGPLDVLVAEYIVWTRANGKAPSYVIKQEMHFRAHFLSRWNRLGQVTTPAIERYKVERIGAGIRTSTLYKEMVSLSRFLRWCRKHGHLDTVPEFDRVRPTTDYQPPNLTPDQVNALLAQLPDRSTHHNRRAVREFFTVQWAQAMRPGEVMTLRWCDVDLDGRRLTVHPLHDKARTGRTIGIAPEAFKVLDALAQEPHASAARVFGRCDYRTSLEGAAKRAKLPEVTPHHLRHARLSELASSTRDVGAVQFFAGHKNLSTTDRYVRSRTERTELMLEGLNSVKDQEETLTKPKKRKKGKR